jgi:hypothetical protein
MIIGEAPDQVEVRKGHPFVGETRGVVNLFLKRIGVTRENSYLTTALKCMLPDSRKPTDAELRHCQGWLDAEIREQDPKDVDSSEGHREPSQSGVGLPIGPGDSHLSSGGLYEAIGEAASDYARY